MTEGYDLTYLSLGAGVQSSALLVCSALGLHVGRVNDAARCSHWYGLADSIDGTGISRYSHMRRRMAEDRLSLFRGLDQGGGA